MYEQTRSDNKKKSLFMRVAATVIAVVLIFLLTGCGSVKQDDIVGTWKCNETFVGGIEPADMEFVLVFEDDGTYSYDAYSNGEAMAYDNGTYEIQGKKLALHSSVDNEDKECKISGNKLVFFEKKYTKAD